MSIEAMKQALEALECIFASTHPYRGDESTFTDEASVLGDKAITSLRHAIEQYEKQAPVAQYSDIVSDGGLDPRNKFDIPQPQREWVGLTDEEGHRIVNSCQTGTSREIFRAIEAKLKEKNT